MDEDEPVVTADTTVKSVYSDCLQHVRSVDFLMEVFVKLLEQMNSLVEVVTTYKQQVLEEQRDDCLLLFDFHI